MLIYAHRGASKAEPENTLRAFRRALDAGAHGIELDLHATADGIPVVIHDVDVSRTTDGVGKVATLRYAELATLDAGRGERIPTLAEVLSLAGDRVHFDLEIKQPGIEHEVLSVLARFPSARWAISSFDRDILRAVRSLASAADLWVLTMALSDDVFAVAHEIGATAVSLYAPAFTPDAAAALARAGLRTVVWTVNDPAKARAMKRLGAYGLCTDVPEVMLAALAPTTGHE